ncbi:MAG TPA: hypothetical protein PLB81_05895 [Deltaproteobacteria bacterium]|nr:hypothetical protein [Deltaproteobacteria bacterium]
MPRELSDRPCSVVFADKISGGTIKFFYARPGTEQRVAYQGALASTDAKLSEVRIEHALGILTGIRDGDFTVPASPEPDAPSLPVSSDPESADYRENWKDLLQVYASDLLEILAIHAFEPYVRAVEERTAPFVPTSPPSPKGSAMAKSRKNARKSSGKS